MHEPVKSQIENLLRGQVLPAVKETVAAHLRNCAHCREELEAMKLHSGMMRALRVPAVEPPAGFYGRVMQRIEGQGRPSFWSLLLDPIFGRRLVYATASLALLMSALLLATGGERPELAHTPVEVLAAPAPSPAVHSTSFGQDVQHDRESFLVTLAGFNQYE